MREILFKGKRADNGDWETGSLVIVRGGLSDEAVYIADKMTGYHTPVIPETVGQFTGFHDKFGRKIFEGDIVTLGESDAPLCVKFTEASWNCLSKKYLSYRYRMSNETVCEVVGNIHDNPELLDCAVVNKKLILKPCPFCGEDVATFTTVRKTEECGNFEGCSEFANTDECHLHLVVCNYNKGGCGSSGAIKRSPEEAAEWWNRRAGERS